MNGLTAPLNQSAEFAALRPHEKSRLGWPIKPAIASLVVAAMLVVATAIIYLGWLGVRESMLLSASGSAKAAGQLITEQSHRMLEPVKATLPILAGTGLAKATTLNQRLQSLRAMVGVLQTSNLVSAVYAGYSDGSFMLVRPVASPSAAKLFGAPPRSKYLVQSLESLSTGGTQGKFLFFDADLAMVASRAMPDYQFDPRTRPWFPAAGTAARSYVSAPYVFFTTQEVGTTLSYASPDRSSVFGVDIVLDDLARRMNELRVTPGTELAMLNSAGNVLTYTDMGRVIIGKDSNLSFQHVDKLGVASLARLNALNPETGKVLRFDVDGTEWLGFALAFDAWQSDKVRLMVAAPVDDFLIELKAKAQRLIVLVIGLVLLLIPFGWKAGATLGQTLDKLTAQAIRMGNFNFDRARAEPTLVKEVNTLADVMGNMGNTIQTFLQISQDLATEPKVERMVDNMLQQLVSATRCSAGAVYLSHTGQPHMRRVAQRGDFVGAFEPGLAQARQKGATVTQHKLAPNLGEMRVELLSRNGALQGILVLQYALDGGQTDPAFAVFVQKLSGVLSVSIETRQLVQQQKNILDVFIRVVAYAIDAKSPYTGGHCERVPVLAAMLIDRIVDEVDGPYADFTMTEEERYEFQLGAWLHDCGKVTSPEHIIDKATKLEAIYNRIHEVRMRFEVLWRDIEIEYWQKLAAGGDRDALKAVCEARQQVLRSDFEFVAKCNVGGESMAIDDVLRLKSIAQNTWLRHFDNRLGLSSEEAGRMAGAPQPTLPALEKLLADRPEHVVAWSERRPAVEKDNPHNTHGFDMVLPRNLQNMGELYNLLIAKGTLTEEDRFRVNEHIVQTLIILRSLPWPSHLAKVPDIAATHHERLDGKGYPRRLTADRLTLADRVMAMVDVFEALTAGDRPYKTPKTLSESLRIMALMAKNQHLDSELFRYFLRSSLWLEFARKFISPEQIDTVDLASLEKLLSEPAKPPT